MLLTQYFISNYKFQIATFLKSSVCETKARIPNWFWNEINFFFHLMLELWEYCKKNFHSLHWRIQSNSASVPPKYKHHIKIKQYERPEFNLECFYCKRKGSVWNQLNELFFNYNTANQGSHCILTIVLITQASYEKKLYHSTKTTLNVHYTACYISRWYSS